MTPPPQPSLYSSTKQWVDSIPIVTRYLFFGTLFLSLAVRTGLVNFGQVILAPHFLLSKYELWRLVTPHFISGGPDILWHLYLLYQNSKNLEEGHYSSRKGDYIFLIMLTMAIIDVAGLYLGYPIFTPAFGMAITYLYAHVNGDQIVSFMFGFQFKAVFLPWVMLFMVRLLLLE
ncbi:Derlin 1 [Kappamyces sp. JEL0829]|nr:Derlin 1 [Kappamyces sp. JEL0829]